MLLLPLCLHNMLWLPRGITLCLAKEHRTNPNLCLCSRKVGGPAHRHGASSMGASSAARGKKGNLGAEAAAVPALLCPSGS